MRAAAQMATLLALGVVLGPGACVAQADITAKAPPPGYTLTLGTTSTHAIAAGTAARPPALPEALASKSPAEFRDMQRGQVTKFVKITKALNIKLD